MPTVNLTDDKIRIIARNWMQGSFLFVGFDPRSKEVAGPFLTHDVTISMLDRAILALDKEVRRLKEEAKHK